MFMYIKEFVTYSWMWPKISSKRNSKNLLINHFASPSNAAKMFTVHFPGNNSSLSTQIDEMEGTLFNSFVMYVWINKFVMHFSVASRSRWYNLANHHKDNEFFDK